MTRNESDTRAELIEPALNKAGWGEVKESRIKREFLIAPGRIKRTLDNTSALKADYVLLYKNENLVVIEAKAEGKSHTEGLQQAKKYGELLNVRFVASTIARLGP